MPSSRTRQAYQAVVLNTAQAALADAAVAVATATDTLTTVQSTIGDIQAGTVDLDAVMVGGQKFVNIDGSLELAP